MKLWGSLTTCLMLLSAVRTSPLQQLTAAKRSRRADESPLELPPVRIQVPGTSPGISRAEAGAEDREEPLAGGEKCKTLVRVHVGVYGGTNVPTTFPMSHLLRGLDVKTKIGIVNVPNGKHNVSRS